MIVCLKSPQLQAKNFFVFSQTTKLGAREKPPSNYDLFVPQARLSYEIPVNKLDKRPKSEMGYRPEVFLEVISQETQTISLVPRFEKISPLIKIRRKKKKQVGMSCWYRQKTSQKRKRENPKATLNLEFNPQKL